MATRSIADRPEHTAVLTLVNIHSTLLPELSEGHWVLNDLTATLPEELASRRHEMLRRSQGNRPNHCNEPLRPRPPNRAGGPASRKEHGMAVVNTTTHVRKTTEDRHEVLGQDVVP